MESISWTLFSGWGVLKISCKHEFLGAITALIDSSELGILSRHSHATPVHENLLTTRSQHCLIVYTTKLRTAIFKLTFWVHECCGKRWMEWPCSILWCARSYCGVSFHLILRDKNFSAHLWSFFYICVFLAISLVRLTKVLVLSSEVHPSYCNRGVGPLQTLLWFFQLCKGSFDLDLYSFVNQKSWDKLNFVARFTLTTAGSIKITCGKDPSR